MMILRERDNGMFHRSERGDDLDLGNWMWTLKYAFWYEWYSATSRSLSLDIHDYNIPRSLNVVHCWWHCIYVMFTTCQGQVGIGSYEEESEQGVNSLTPWPSNDLQGGSGVFQGIWLTGSLLTLWCWHWYQGQGHFWPCTGLGLTLIVGYTLLMMWQLVSGG